MTDALSIHATTDVGWYSRFQSSSNLQTRADVTGFIARDALVVLPGVVSTNADSEFFRVVSP